MPDPVLSSAAGMAYREAPAPGPPVLCLHGYPTSSYLWRHALPAIAAAGRRAIAPDLPGFGHPPPLRPGTWEAQGGAVERSRSELGLERVGLGVHDWGGLIGLRLSLHRPDAVSEM